MRIGPVFAVVLSSAVGAGWLVAGIAGALLAGAAALLIGMSLYLGASACVLRLAGAAPLQRADAPALCRLVEQLAAQCGLPAAPRLYWLPGDAPNALATGRDPAHAALAVTPALVAFLERDELAGVLTRELACIRRRDTRWGDVAAALAGGLMLIASRPSRSLSMTQAARSADGRSARSDPGWRAAPLWIAGRLARAATSPERVCAADGEGAGLLGDPFPIARALAIFTVVIRRPPRQAVNPGLAHLFAVMPHIAESLRSFCLAPPILQMRLQGLTRQALLPAVKPEWTLESSHSIRR